MGQDTSTGQSSSGQGQSGGETMTEDTVSTTTISEGQGQTGGSDNPGGFVGSKAEDSDSYLREKDSAKSDSDTEGSSDESDLEGQ